MPPPPVRLKSLFNLTALVAVLAWSAADHPGSASEVLAAEARHLVYPDGSISLAFTFLR